jgi:hypothetical protein
MNDKSNVCFRLHINNNIALKKNSSECKMILKKKKSLIKFKTNQNFTLKTKSLKKVKNFEKYGDKIKHQLIYLVFKNVNKVNLEIKIKFL